MNQARDALRRHLTAAAEATSAAVGLAVMGRALDAEALEVLAGAAHQHLVDAGRADGFDVEDGFDDQHPVPAAVCPGGGA